MNTATQITQVTLGQLHDQLPHGAMTEIAKRVKCSYNYVYLVLRGKIGLNDKSKAVIQAGLDIIKEKQNEAKNVSDQIKEVTQ